MLGLLTVIGYIVVQTSSHGEKPTPSPIGTTLAQALVTVTSQPRSPSVTAIAGEIAQSAATRVAFGPVKPQAEATATVVQSRLVSRVDIEVFLDANLNGGIDVGIDPLYVQSNYQIRLRVGKQNIEGRDYSSPEVITVRDSDDGAIDGRAWFVSSGDYYAEHVQYNDPILDLAPGYKDVSSICSGPPLQPNGCVHGALLYDWTSATLRLLVQKSE